MTVQAVIQELAAMGPLPSEDAATVEDLEVRQRLVEQIVKPVSDDDAQVLITVFGPDTCFGASWTILHLIETAPSALTASYSANRDNEWVQMLEKRRQMKY
jgi:hypothetical protein